MDIKPCNILMSERLINFDEINLKEIFMNYIN